MTDCIFCKIIAGEIPSDKVYEDDAVLAFMDIRPVSRGHVLVVPKIHSANILETEDEVAAVVLKQTKKITAAVNKAVGADGFTISTNIGEAAGQTVFHLHFHVIPRSAKDGLKPWPHQEIAPKTRAEIAAEIKKHL